MADIQHPLRTARIVVYQRISGKSAPDYIAMIEPIATYPIYFTGSCPKAVEEKAREWCDARADENEARFIARAERAAKRKKVKPE